GDFGAYWKLRDRAERLREDAREGNVKAYADETKTALAALRPGDVIVLPTARRRGLAVVINNR
ncbi:MAG TPA: hypothetical protein DIT48_09305, partial [Actinobacteria bacterium]|nr:hypothetical protein [Actinomycetota bacterium]